jgi:hypothetical protein
VRLSGGNINVYATQGIAGAGLNFNSTTSGWQGKTAEFYQTGGHVTLWNATGGYGGSGNNNTGSVIVGDANNCDGNYTIAGGSLEIFRWESSTAGGLLIGRSQVKAGIDGNFPTGNALFHVLGSGATRIFSGDDVRVYRDGTVQFTIDGGGITPIDANDDILFFAGSKLTVDLASGYTPAQNQKFTLMRQFFSSQTVDANWTLGPGVSDSWSVAVEDQGGGVKYVVATYLLPEPATLALVGIGGAVLLRRRRKAA